MRSNLFSYACISGVCSYNEVILAAVFLRDVYLSCTDLIIGLFFSVISNGYGCSLTAVCSGKCFEVVDVLNLLGYRFCFTICSVGYRGSGRILDLRN